MNCKAITMYLPETTKPDVYLSGYGVEGICDG